MRLRQGCGQVFPLVAIMMSGLIGVTAFVVDVGAWDQNQRSMQATADAAALAGAEDLPYDQTGASALAASYAAKNAGGTPTISFPAADTIDVTVQDYGSGAFATVYGSQNKSVRITGEAVARSRIVTAAQGVVPLVVTKNQPQLTGCPYPCFNTPATLKINDDATVGGGQAGLIDLTGTGSVTSTQIADWVTNGLSSPLPSNAYYYSAGSCKFSNQNFHSALDARVAAGAPLLFPVYDPSRTDTTTNPPRHYIVGFAAFVVTSYRLNGCGNKSDFIGGYFVHDVTTGVSDGTATSDYGVRTITLTG